MEVNNKPVGNMDQLQDFKYYAIKLWDPPYTDSDKYVCVPNSWIRLRDTTDNTAIVKFPIEDLSETKKRVERGEEFSKDWMVFCAELKCATNSYTDACNFVKILHNLPEENDMDNFTEDVPTTTGMGKMLESMTLETNQVSSALRNANIEVSDNQTTSKNTYFSNPEQGLHQATTKIVKENEFIPKPKKFWAKRSLTQPVPPDTFNVINQNVQDEPMETTSREENINEIQNNQESPPCPKTPFNRSLKSFLLRIQRALSNDDFRGALKSLRSEWKSMSIMYENLHQAYVKNYTTLDELIEYTDQVSDLSAEDFPDEAEEEENSTKQKEKNVDNEVFNNVSGLGVQNEGQKENVTNDYDKNTTDESDDEDDQSPPQKIRCRTRKFTLPPEYDPNDSRWTLKHRKKEKGLVELEPHTGVYINAIKLGHCKIMAKNSQTLARMLLVEIFKQSALCTCSITGRQSHIFDPKGTNVRPGLDKSAMTVLLNYVFAYARDNNWHYPETAVMNSLRCKLTEIRAKYA